MRNFEFSDEFHAAFDTIHVRCSLGVLFSTRTCVPACCRRRFFENRAGVPEGQAELNIFLKLASYPVKMYYQNYLEYLLIGDVIQNIKVWLYSIYFWIIYSMSVF